MSYAVSKSVVPYTAQRVTISTTKSVKEVITALDKEVNKAAGGVNMMTLLATANSKEEIDKGMARLTEDGKRDFVLYAAGSHSRWLNPYFEGKRKFPETHIYNIGNPLIAQTMLSLNMAAGLNVPPKLLVVENDNGKGGYIMYDLPSSVVGDARASAELKKAALILDEKLEKMVRKVLG